MNEKCNGCVYLRTKTFFIKNYCAISYTAKRHNWQLFCPCHECLIKMSCRIECRKRTAILRYSIGGDSDSVRHVFNNW
jgi:hypothetical protein